MARDRIDVTCRAAHTGRDIGVGAIAFNPPRALIRYHDMIGQPATVARQAA